jgi:uncharacterized protein (TIGR02147 family)
MSDLRKYLADEFAQRAQKNPAYSLRAFARNLDLDSSYLSKILNGKRQLTSRTIINLCRKLGMGPDEIQKFINAPQKPQRRRDLFTSLDIDNFKIISEWYHFAILELVRLDDFVPDAQWIAKTLKITFAEALAAVERLKRVGLISETAGRWQINGFNTTTNNNFTNEALKKLQKQFLEKAIQALDEVPYQERDQSGMTMAVSSDRLEKAKEKIKKFRRDLMDFLEGGEEKDRVYQLTISLFPVSYNNKENRT